MHFSLCYKVFLPWNRQKERLLRHMCFTCYEHMSNILCNWLILWQNAFYLYLGRSMMFLILQKTRFQDQVLKSSSLSKKTSWKCKFIKAQQLHLSSLRKLFKPRMLNNYSTPSICWGLRISEFWYDFLGIRECLWAFFSPNPRHIKEFF